MNDSTTEAHDHPPDDSVTPPLPTPPTVVFKGTQAGISVFLNESDDFEDIKRTLSQEAGQKKKFFGNASTKISFKGRILSPEQEAELIGVIHEQTDLKVNFKPIDDYENLGETVPATFAAPPTPSRFRLKGKKNKAEALTQPPITKVAPLVSAGHNETFYHHGSLRSGQSINYAGSVVIVGNVNAGSSIIAHGNIVVLGSLKGVARAGYTGNHDCFVAALDFLPTQIRIADLITYIPDDHQSAKFRGRHKQAVPHAAMAYARDKQIFIVPL